MVYTGFFWGGYGVDIFLILSGFGITYSRLEREAQGYNETWINYYKRRILRIIPKYLFIASMFYFLTVYSIKEFFYNLSFLNFIIIDGERDFWYIITILICYLLFPIYREISKKINFRISFFLIGLTGEIVALATMVYFPESYNNLEIALWRFPCFWIGCYYGMLVFKNKMKEFYFVTGIFTVLGLILFFYYGFIRNVFMFTSPCIMFIICFFLEVFRVYKGIIGEGLRYLGKISLELYLIHVSLGVWISEYIYSKIPNDVIRLITYFLSSILLAIIVNYLFIKIMNTKIYIQRKNCTEKRNV